jgi:hypothetical protein
MSTATRPSASRSAGNSPAIVSMVIARPPLSAISKSATQRVPLPQAPASLPSAL